METATVNVTTEQSHSGFRVDAVLTSYKKTIALNWRAQSTAIWCLMTQASGE